MGGYQQCGNDTPDFKAPLKKPLVKLDSALTHHLLEPQTEKMWLVFGLLDGNSLTRKSRLPWWMGGGSRRLPPTGSAWIRRLDAGRNGHTGETRVWWGGWVRAAEQVQSSGL